MRKTLVQQRKLSLCTRDYFANLIYVEITEDSFGDSDYFTLSINGKTWCKFQDEQRAEIMFDMFCKHIDDYLTFDTLLDMPEELRTASSGPDEW